jgi:hypothetical protein
MYETESNAKVEPLPPLPAEVLLQLEELKKNVELCTVLPWSEHCTECVWPTCYSTCDLYEPREDGRCRRFIDGMVRILRAPSGLVRSMMAFFTVIISAMILTLTSTPSGRS